MSNNYNCPVDDIDRDLNAIDSACDNLMINHHIDYDPNSSLSEITSALDNIKTIDKSLREELKNQHDKQESMKSNMLELYDIIKDLRAEIEILENQREEY